MKLNRIFSGKTLLALSLSLWIASLSAVQAESLFRASAEYNDSQPGTPRSLFTQLRPQHVGDTLTIQVNETVSTQTKGELKVSRSQTLNENGTGIINSIVHTFGLPQKWSLPTFDGIKNSNDLSSTVDTTRSSKITDTVTCQVVQVLPNGHLVVQGNKIVAMNKEQENLVVTGIVNPFYLNQKNQIASTMVANFQMLRGGKGVVSRQQGDGLASKFYQFVN